MLLTVALNGVNLISVLSMNIVNCENRKETNFIKKSFYFAVLLETNQSSDILQHSQNRPTRDRRLKL